MLTYIVLRPGAENINCASLLVDLIAEKAQKCQNKIYKQLRMDHLRKTF